MFSAEGERMRHQGFPSEETLEAFIHHKLDEVTRRNVVMHMAACTECYTSWAAAQKSTAQVGRRKPIWSRMVIIVAAVGLVTPVVFLSPLPQQLHLDDASLRMDALVARADELPFRTILPRLSPTFGHRPLQDNMRSGTARSQRWRIAGVAADFRRTVDSAPTAENLHALGVSYLLIDRFEEAVQTLEQARAQTSGEAVLLDLAAAYYARGMRRGSIRDVARSLDVTDAVLAIANDNRPAQFNRALALEALQNRPSALAAWKRYLQLDPSSEWAAEARQHVDRLTIPARSAQWERVKSRFSRLSAADLNQIGSIAEQFPLRARRAAENELLPRWARARERGDTADADLVLTAVQSIGAAIQSRYGDPTIAEIARTVSTSLGNPNRLKTLVRGYLAYGEGRAARESNTTTASASFRTAWKQLRDAGSPSAYTAGMSAAAEEYTRRNYGEALQLLATMKSEPALKRHPPLAGQVLWMEAMVLLAMGRPYASLQRYREARSAFLESGEVESIAAVDGLIAENLQALGDDEEAWKHRLRAIPVVLDYADTRRQQVAFDEAAEAAMQQEHLSAALEYQTSSALVARSNDPYAAAYAYLGRALILGRKGGSVTALADIGRARAYAQSVRDDVMRSNTTADVDLAEALLLQRDSPAEAIPLLTQILEYQRRSGYEFRAAQLLLARGRAYVRLGDGEQARADFSRAIATIESQREHVADVGLRSAFFGKARDAYEELTALLVRSGEFAEARRVFDRSCERTLTEVVRSVVAGDAALRARDDPPMLTNGTALVQIAALPDEIVAWTTRGSGTSIARRPISSQRVEELVAAYERAILANSPDVKTISSRLHDLLVRPLALDPVRDRTIVIVADRALRNVPMASLYDGARKRYLIEDHALVTAPSAALYWHCKARRRSVLDMSRVIAIGNTKTARLALGLPDLAEAERELTEVASRSSGRLILDDRATPSTFLAAVESASVVHFAGHALVNEQDRGRSALVLSPDGPDPSSALLSADRIASAQMRASLVVLSACTTNSRDSRAAKGAIDVARAFLAAGVPTVVTSRWEVADARARDLLTAFTRELARSQSPAEALRNSQLEILRRGDLSRAVQSWCAFEIMGSD